MIILLLALKLFIILPTFQITPTLTKEQSLPNSNHFLPISTEIPRIPLKYSRGGYLIDGQIISSKFNKLNKTSTKIAPMVLALYSSDTILFKDNCLNFEVFNCNEYNCTTFNNSLPSKVLPYFTSEGALTQAEAYTGQYTDHQPHTVLCSTCESEYDSSFGNKAFGLVGTGNVNIDSWLYLKNTSSFSVFVNYDFSYAELILGLDATYIEGNEHIGYRNIKADENWHINSDHSEIIQINVMNKTLHGKNYGIIFDINADAIGFPLEIYHEILEKLSMEGVSNCTGLYRPVCTYKGEIQHFPGRITLTIDKNNVLIDHKLLIKGYNFLKPDDIVTSVTLNIKVIAPNLGNKSYVTPAYSDYIILDSNFMSYYYTEFTIDPKTSINYINLYKAKQSLPINYSILVSIVTVVFFGAFWCVWKMLVLDRTSKKCDEIEDPLMTRDQSIISELE